MTALKEAESTKLVEVLADWLAEVSADAEADAWATDSAALASLNDVTACESLADPLAKLASTWDVTETETDPDADKEAALASDAETCAEVLSAESLWSLRLSMDLDKSDIEASLKLATDVEIAVD